MKYYISNDMHGSSLEHFGVPGMKWGVRKQRYQPSGAKSRLDNAKRNAKLARNAKSANRYMYNKSFNTAYSHSQRNPISQFKKGSKQQMVSDKLWKRADNDRNAYVKSREKYKSAKTELKAARKARKEAINKKHEEINKNASKMEKVVYNDATRKYAAKLITDNKNMSYDTAMKKAKTKAWRNTAIATAALLTYADIASGGQIHRSVGKAVMNTKDKINPRTIYDDGRMMRKAAKNVYQPTVYMKTKRLLPRP